jgi:hypothetical protein
MSELSPAAQAVLDAFLGDAENTGLQMDDLRENVAAALRAVVESSYLEDYEFRVCDARKDARNDILAIADELEGQP